MKPKIVYVTQGRITTDGDGVKLYRILPLIHYHNHNLKIFEINPFLLFDEFKSEDENEYKNGFPMHPHKGFQTITYMKKGSFQHQDTLGNTSLISEGGVQWMNAGSGIRHSEMPIISKDKKIWGFQLWLNLPKKYKYSKPWYKNIEISEIPVEDSENFTIKILAGQTNLSTKKGYINEFWNINFFDIFLNRDHSVKFESPSLNKNHWTLIYIYDGKIEIENQKFENKFLLIISETDEFNLKAIENSQFLFISSPILEEEIVRYGPFVMNTKQEIEKTLWEYQNHLF